MKILNRIKSKLSKNYIDYDTIKHIIDLINEIYQEQEVRLFLADYENLRLDEISQYHVGGNSDMYVDYIIEHSYPNFKDCANYCGSNNKNISIVCGKRNVYFKKTTYKSYDFDAIHSTNIESYIITHGKEISETKNMTYAACILTIPKLVYTMCVECIGTDKLVKDILRKYLLSKEIDYVNSKLKKVESKYGDLLAIKRLVSSIEDNNHDD